MADDDILDDDQTIILTLSESEAQLLQRALSDARKALSEFVADTESIGDLMRPMITVALGETEVIDDLLSRLDEG